MYVGYATSSVDGGVILHGILTPNVIRKNSLNGNILNFGPQDKFDYVLINPPFGGTENKQIQQHFPIKVQATQLLAMQHVMRRLKPGGKCGIVVPESVLSATDNAYVKIKKEMIENFNLLVDIPSLPIEKIRLESYGYVARKSYLKSGSSLNTTFGFFHRLLWSRESFKVATSDCPEDSLDSA